MKDYAVRKAGPEDLDEIMAIYDYARQRMARAGNPRQWIDGYPSWGVIAADIDCGNCYKLERDGRISGVFAFIPGADPTYDSIEGEWLNDHPYGTIHRIASAPGARGIADACLEFCQGHAGDIRIDTHEDNAPMLGWIRSRGFAYCGIIRCHNGTPRLAFQKSL